MENEFKVTFENDYVKVISNGEKNSDFAKKVWARTVEICLANNCYKILGIANTTKPISISEGYNHHEFFPKLGINYKFRIAWVELNSAFLENTRFIETVLNNRGLPGKMFTDIDEAKKWLLTENP